MFFDRKTQFIDFDTDQFDKHYLSTVSFVFRLKNIVFSAINRVYQRQIYNIGLSKNYVFRSIYIVFRDKLCFSSEKLCFSIEKHCLSPINSVFRFITHLACHTHFLLTKFDIFG